MWKLLLDVSANPDVNTLASYNVHLVSFWQIGECQHVEQAETLPSIKHKALPHFLACTTYVSLLCT